MINESIVIGNEYDEKLIKSLFLTLQEIGAVKKDESSALVGSQDYYLARYEVNNLNLTVEIETYIGVTLSGPSNVVREISNKLKRTAQIASIHHATKKVRKMHLVVFGYLLFCAVSIASFCVYSLAVVQFYSKV